MRPEPKKRIPTNPPQDGLNSAFARLDLPSLTPDPATTAPIAETPPHRLGRVVVRRETARRAGRTVMVIDGFSAHIHQSEIEALAKRLRCACGSGGAVKGRAIEIQGDQIAKMRALLEGEGFEVAGVR